MEQLEQLVSTATIQEFLVVPQQELVVRVLLVNQVT
jgi:hypothetical protein